MAASSSYCLAWRGAAMAFSYPPSSPSPLMFCVANPHRLPSTPPLPCLSFRFRTRAGKGLKQEKETYMEIESIQGEQEKVGEVESMDGNGDGSSVKDSEAPSESIVDSAKAIESYSETLVDSTKTLAVDSETLVVSAKTLEADCETLVDSVKTLVVDSRTLVAPSETLKVASETLEVASETLESASETLVADSETLADTASALNVSSESARNGKPQTALPVKDQPQTTSLSMNGDKFEDARWKNGTWDLEMFKKDGEISWDDVIDAEVLRRKWLQDRPESTNNDEPVVFESSVIPWWAWVKRFHLPEAELLNGRAAMIGFFMAYLVDSLTGVGLVDQMSSFFGKLLLFITVVGVMAIRKNADAETIIKFVKEWSFYDKQWQATWQEDPPSSEKKE